MDGWDIMVRKICLFRDLFRNSIFRCILVAPWLTLDTLGPPRGSLLVPLGSILVSFNSLLVPFGSVWVTFGTLFEENSKWLTFGSPWFPFGLLEFPSVQFWHPFRGDYECAPDPKTPKACVGK